MWHGTFRNGTLRNGTLRNGVRRRALQAALGIALAGLAASSAPAEVIAYSFDTEADDFVELRLEPGIEPRETARYPLSPVLSPAPMRLEARGSTVYWLSPSPLSFTVLTSMDLAGGEILFQHVLSVGWLALALHPDGTLWMAKDRELYSFDPADASFSLRAPLPDGDIVRDLAWWQGKLYALLEGPDPFSDPSLAEIDPTSGALSNRITLTGSAAGGGLERYPQDIAFDADGGVWIGIVESSRPWDPHGIVVHYRDPWTDPTPTVARWSAAGNQHVMPLAIVGTAGVPDVPTVDRLGAALLALLLTAAAIPALRRR